MESVLEKWGKYLAPMVPSQLAFTSSKLTIETLEQSMKYVHTFTSCSSVSIINFEQVNADWVT